MKKRRRAMARLRCDTLREAKQAAFTGAVRGLHSQEWKQCVDAHNYCRWNLGEPGVHCAVGWLIPWENQAHVDPGDQQILIALGLLHPELRRYANDHDFSFFLAALQDAHDGSSKERPMQKEFMAFGERYGLTWPSDVPAPGMSVGGTA